MPRDTLGDLTDHLFAELERLGDESITGDALESEIKRAKAVTDVASQIIANANTVLRAYEFKDNALNANTKLPRMLTDGERQ